MRCGQATRDRGCRRRWRSAERPLWNDDRGPHHVRERATNRRQLEYFLAVAEHGSLSRAARLTKVAQPSLSQAIAGLEQSVGMQLFRRTPSGVELTSAGEALLGPATQVIRSFGAATAALDALRGMTSGKLQLVSPPTLAQDPLARLLGAYRLAHPGIFITVRRPRRGAGSVEQVLDGQAEIALTVEGAEPRGLVAEPFLEQVLNAILPEDSPVGDDPTIEEILAAGLVVTPRGGLTRGILEAHVGEERVRDAVAVETDHQGSLIPLALAGAGASFVPESQAVEATALGVRAVRTRPLLTRRLVLAYRDGWLSPAGTAFLELARRACAEASTGDHDG
ncbi:LysR family transcriptional regulator [Pseudonocardia nigra]|uniref:LysR family transcriptional regulator n=1 Tax=Pseudonocardia nigra TaxID=1921578 RepID=UPI001C5D17EE|nr:LysR family transcriptional regulator [Pseudonocardia nigra]